MALQSGTQNTEESPLDRAMRLSGRAMLTVCVFSFVLNLLFLTSPLYMLQVYDRVLASGAHETLFYVTVIALIALIVLGVLEGLRQSVLSRFGAWLHDQVSGPVLSASLDKTLAQRHQGAPGLRDLQSIQGFVASRMILPIFDAPWSPVFIAVIWMLHPILGQFALASVVLLFGVAVVNDVMTRKSLDTANREFAGAQQMADHAMSNAATLKSMGMMDAFLGRYRERASRSQLGSARAAERGGWISGASRAIRLILQVGILGLGALLVLEGDLSPGGMIAGSILLSRALAPVEQSIGAWKAFNTARKSRERLRTLFADWREDDVPAALPTPTGRLDVEHLSVRTPSGDGLILRDISFSLEAGECLAIIGPSAAGKSTLIGAIAGVIPAAGGHVRLDGADLEQYPQSQIGEAVGYLPQTVQLFDATVRENISRLKEVEPDSVYAAAQLAGVHELIKGLPDGYETEIGHGGAFLSGGQRQRIALARAVFGGPALVLLDEPAANLDNPGELALGRALKALKANKRTVIMVAHRASQVSHVDKIAVLKDGVLADFGPRAEVLARLSGETNAPTVTKITDRKTGA